LQAARLGRHARALHAQHHGQKLLREQKLVRVHAVVGHQQPSATSLLQGMKLIACGGLRDLVEDEARPMSCIGHVVGVFVLNRGIFELVS
jgi:hypothetical protein